MKKGAALARTWKEGAKSQGDAFERAYGAITSVLKSTLISYSVDPPLPVLEPVRDEFDAYRKTSLQEHLYELLFKEDDSAEVSTSALEMPPLCTDERPTAEQFEFDASEVRRR